MNAIALSGVFLDLVARTGPNVDVGIVLAVAPAYTERMRRSPSPSR